MSHNLHVKNGAFFVADAHESQDKRRSFGKFLDDICSGKLQPTQLFLMGDMYDILIGNIKYSQTMWSEQINKIDEIAKKIDVFYFEGNHDFNLEDLFLHVKIFSMKNQPQYFNTEKGILALSHGDCFESFFYKIYTAFIRSKITIFILQLFEKISGNAIAKYMTKKLERKKICEKIQNFNSVIDSKIDNYQNCNYIVEGHYHQNTIFEYKNIIYINFGSFACDKVYYVFTCENGVKFIQKKFDI